MFKTSKIIKTVQNAKNIPIMLKKSENYWKIVKNIEKIENF